MESENYLTIYKLTEISMNNFKLLVVFCETNLTTSRSCQKEPDSRRSLLEPYCSRPTRIQMNVLLITVCVCECCQQTNRCRNVRKGICLYAPSVHDTTGLFT